MLCHKSEIPSGVIVAIVSGLVYVFIDATTLPQLTNIKEQKSPAWTPVPWLGVLILEGEYTIESEGMILVTIISDKVGIADAKSMAALNKYKWEDIRNNTHVTFMTKTNQYWNAKIDKFILHPDFSGETLTTMAILNLEYDLENFEGNMVKWPFNFSYPTYRDAEIFTIGYTVYRDHKLEQTLYRMDYIQLSECQNFYFLEALDTKWMRPKHYHCYKVRYNKQSCVFDPAMALVHYAAGKYTLMGLSVWGPGCALPSRFFDFEPFVPWIMSKVQTRRDVRYYWRPERVTYRFKPGRGDRPTKKTRDKWFMERLFDAKGYVLKPIKGEAEEIVLGPCDAKNTLNDMLVYKEVQEYRTRRRGDARNIRGIAVYTLSLYDLRYGFGWNNRFKCIQIIAKCKQKSDSTLEFSKGQGNEPLDPYVKSGVEHHPSYFLNKYVHIIQNNYEIIEEHTTHLTFRFEFERQATIEILFYTTFKVPTTVKTTTIPIQKRSRHRRPYTTSTKNPPREYSFYKYGYNKHGGWTTKSVIYRPTTTRTTTRKTKRPAINGSTYWWNEWWHYVTKPYPALDRDWWKG